VANIFISKAHWYSLRYPDNWEAEDGEDCATICEPKHGAGALQISAYSTPLHQDPRDVLLEYLSDNDLAIDERRITSQQVERKSLCSYELTNDKGFERLWFISQGSYVLFVTYLCNLEDSGKEIGKVEEIIDSITITDGSDLAHP